MKSSVAGTDTILTVDNLSVDYGSKKAVDDISFSIKKGEIFGLLGPNGAGKTSTLSAIEGLLRPTSGSMKLDGVDMQQHPAEVKTNMGVQLQSTSFQFELTINQLIKLYAGLYNVQLSVGDTAEALKNIGLGNESGKRYKELSGGQQQRLSLFIANIHHPILLLLDEPTSGLDPQSRRQLWDTIEENRRNGGSILLTTHSMEEAQAVCDRVAIIDHGKVITTGTPTGLIKQHEHDPRVRKVARGRVTLEDVFIGLTGSEVRE
jgi:ABC-2 type transport system ATP-binding protein